MNPPDQRAAQFEEHRGHLKAVAYRMLGSLSEAEDAVQDAWLRYSRSDTSDVENLGGWLTTVVARICLNLLRARRSRRELPSSLRLPDPVVTRAEETDPAEQALVADAVGMAMLVVLETLSPAERVAFVLHDVFGVPFDQVAPIVGRTPTAARQLASRARRRVHQSPAQPDADLRQQRAVVSAFQAAARSGDFQALLAVLDPDVVVRADFGARRATQENRGAVSVAENAMSFAPLAGFARPALVNGTAGLVIVRDGRPLAVLGFTVRGGKIVELDILGDPARLRHLDVSILDD
ncbi:MAG TPA: RNA polymerase sigma factor SigJ [Candidatus Limnocylindria bacterium]|nr:RNA polymerase sigma factor SigJ [Candidatus Limnocylindria bacterium]